MKSELEVKSEWLSAFWLYSAINVLANSVVDYDFDALTSSLLVIPLTYYFAYYKQGIYWLLFFLVSTVIRSGFMITHLSEIGFPEDPRLLIFYIFFGMATLYFWITSARLYELNEAKRDHPQ